MNVSGNGPHISVCCNPEGLYPLESSCHRNRSDPDANIMFPEIYDANFSISTMSRGGFVHEYDFSCNGSTYDLEPYSPKNDLFFLMENGAIYAKKSIDGGADYWLGTEDYCLAYHQTENGSRMAVSVCKPFLETDSNPLTVMPETIVYSITISMSLPFLVATFLVYTILPELKNIHGLILRVYVACLFVFYTLFIIITAHPRILCTYYIGVVLHFLVLATFFWLNVMSFDIWWTFRRFRSVQGSPVKGNRKKFVIYSIYAWGSSSLVAGVGCIIDSLPVLPKEVIKPGLRTGFCWFGENLTAAWVWLYSPMALTIICNTAFFVLTAMTINRHEKDTAHCLKHCDYRRHDNEKQRFHLYVKLFIVMGITWSAEIILWKFESLPVYMSYILDLPNLLQGVTIFMIFVWKDKVKRLLRKRLKRKDRRPRSNNTMNKTPRLTSPDSCTTSTRPTSQFDEYIDIPAEESNHIVEESRYI